MYMKHMYEDFVFERMRFKYLMLISRCVKINALVYSYSILFYH